MPNDESKFETSSTKKLESRLSTFAENTLASILCSSFEAIIVTDNSTRITTFNEGAEKMFGYDRDTIIGQSIDMLIPSRFQGDHHTHVDNFSKSQTSSFKMDKVNEVVGLRSDGDEFPIAASVSKIVVDDDHIFSIIIRDMSESVAQEKILRTALEKAKASTEAKTSFLATMSHEIRTPLHGILGMAQLLQRSITTDTQAQYVSAIENSGRTLLGLINDLLDISRVEAGLMDLELGELDIQSFLADQLPGFDTQAQAKGISLSVDIEESAPRTIFVDRLRLGQILSNLIGNAIKFTDQGHVSIRVFSEREDMITFSVLDTGIGIPQTIQGGIFDRFSQSDETIQRRYGGTGLGLSIVKELVSLMSGTLDLESVEGKGSRFWFSIPLTQPSEELKQSIIPAAISNLNQLQKPATLQGSGKLALVVDDVETNRLVCSSILEEIGYNTLECDSGFAALEALKSNDIDIVFMDLHMPNMSGDECIRAIRNSGASFNNVPIVVLTADASESAADLAKSAGADDSYTKPFTLKEMSEVSEKLASPNPQSSQSDSALHIVLIDDDNTEQLLLRELISDLNHNIQFDYFENAQSFCEQGHSTEETLLLLDGNIPPFSSHEESLQLIQTQGCQARIYLLSADKYTKTLDVEGLNIVAPLDKLKIQSSENLESFIESAIASKTL